MGQGGGTRQKLPLRSGQEALSGIRGTAGGAEVGSLERGRFTGTDRCKGFLKEAAVEGIEACGEGSYKCRGRHVDSISLVSEAHVSPQP